MNPNERTVVIKLKRNQVCRLLVLIAVAVHSDDLENVRKIYKEIHAKVLDDLAEHDKKWSDYNAV